MNYTLFRNAPGSYVDQETGVIIDVDIVAQCPEGIVVNETTLDYAVDKAVDYILDEGLEDD